MEATQKQSPNLTFPFQASLNSGIHTTKGSMALTTFSLSLCMLLLSLVVMASASGYGYAPKAELQKPKKQVELLPSIAGIQGLIYCKSGPKLVPLEGALARITCLAVDKNGYESAPFSVLSHPTDAKGYFFATVSPYELEDALKITECKAFLEKSPLETCKVPTDVNKGISGATLTSYHFLADKNIKLYSVGPFFYTPQPKPVSKGY